MSRPVASALKLGQAPAYWVRDLARRNVSFKVLPRACAWVAGFGAAHYRLLDWPLLGSCLGQLLAGDNQIGKAAVPAAQPMWPRQGKAVHPAPKRHSTVDLFTLPDEVPLRQRISPFHGEAESKGRKLKMMGTPRVADAAHLHRLAGKMAMLADQSRSEKRYKPYKHLLAPKRRSFQALGAGYRIRPDNLAIDGWQERLARRAIDVLRRSVSSRMPAWSSPSPAASESTAALPLQPWSASMSGPKVGAEMLARIVQDVQYDHMAVTKRGREDVSAQPMSDKSFQESATQTGEVVEPASSRRFAAGGNRDSTAHGDRSSADRGRPGESPVSQVRRVDGTDDIGAAPDAPRTYQDALSFLQKRKEAGRDREWGHIAPVNPPRMAVALPLLTPSHEVKVPVPTIAVATARQGMLTESTTAANDMDRLAAMIKDILDEQARRHGIDV